MILPALLSRHLVTIDQRVSSAMLSKFYWVTKRAKLKRDERFTGLDTPKTLTLQKHGGHT